MEFMKMFLTTLLLIIFEFYHTEAYRKYYVEDECVSPTEFQKIFFKLPPSGPDSVGEVRSNRFGTYSRTGRNCLIKLLPPKGFGVLVTILRVDFRNHEACKDYIKILDDNSDGEKLCGYNEPGLHAKTYFSDNAMRILYHTNEGGMGFSNGFRFVFTVTKLDMNDTTCSAPDEFMCQNTHCIWAGVQCDGINNCGDGSDENSTEHPHCSMYKQLKQLFFSRIAEVTPIAIAAVVLGITSLIAVLILLCLCCCRPQHSVSRKASLVENSPHRSNGGYMPLPGYTFDVMDHGFPYQQPIHSQRVQPSAPLSFSSSYPSSKSNPYIQRSIEIQYHHPPPPYKP
nr:abnormal cell migration protein 13 isoform X1 [Parasteatoda tepidariorum]